MMKDKRLITRFMPLMQQELVMNSEEHVDVIKRLEKEISEIPNDSYSKTVYASFYIGESRIFVLSWDKEDSIFCFNILNGDLEMAELGYQSLSEIVAIKNIELNFYWNKCSLAQAKYRYYPDYFPNPDETEFGIESEDVDEDDWRAKFLNQDEDE